MVTTAYLYTKFWIITNVMFDCLFQLSPQTTVRHGILTFFIEVPHVPVNDGFETISPGVPYLFIVQAPIRAARSSASSSGVVSAIIWSPSWITVLGVGM